MSGSVCLVIPAYNAATTLRQCLGSTAPLLEQGQLSRIIVVDDGSTDATPDIAAEFPVTCIHRNHAGRGGARNVGWRAATEGLVWFMDADCVAEPDALQKLLPHLDDASVAGVGGSYGNMNPDSLLACLIHEEIVERHIAMPPRVNFLATFNVIYRRTVLEQVQGFDERYLRGQDADLAWRIVEAGHKLAFEVNSRVKHFHPVTCRRYLRAQAQQGYWRFWLHLRHTAPATGDSYSRLSDNAQPPLAALSLLSLPVLLLKGGWIAPAALAVLLVLSQLPMTLRLVLRTRKLRFLLFAPMSFVRAFARALGLCIAALAWITGRSPSTP